MTPKTPLGSQFPNQLASRTPSCAFSPGIPQATCALDPSQAPGLAKAGPKVTVPGPAGGAGEGIPVRLRSRRVVSCGAAGARSYRDPGPEPAPQDARGGAGGAAGAGGWRGRTAREAGKVPAGQEPGRGPRPHSPATPAPTGRDALWHPPAQPADVPAGFPASDCWA